MDSRKKPAFSDRTHKLLVMVTGAGGGSFGLPALAVELPVTTTIMLRSIADLSPESLKESTAKSSCARNTIS